MRIGGDCQVTKKKKKFGSKIKFFLAFLIFGAITSILGYNLFCNIKSINAMEIQKKELSAKITDLEKEKESLEQSIVKLNDPDYIAKYVREKYLYSKDGELILRMKD